LGTSATNEFYSAMQLSVAPNPFSDNIIVDISANLKSPIFRLYDQIGRTVREYQLTFGVTDLDTKNVQPGIYFWEVSGNEGRIATGKIIKTGW